ncbi:unnamed protein product [Musa acuminata subsp. malaccensis]|uniref:(wild Malaysian banana) hypothetical protein n=1 Tax=Musa acuminata subsp. malaccensis TaxID=214687 RepID=A0A804IKV3_MUSAM|nr:PREDICTED: protein trichome birefringence-like 19 [Musa acuminata subsp. malaccensis]CAG1841145.1 unnamed protein product [Musa acuminata subsp. malaccensis]
MRWENLLLLTPYHIMKPYSPELQNGSSRTSLQNTPRIVLLLTATLFLLTIIPLYLFPLLATSFAWRNLSSPPSSPSPSLSSSSSSPSSSSRDMSRDAMAGVTMAKSSCDIFRGEWVPNPNAPYYTNETCWAIHEHQNCMKFGRPDTEFLKWRWKPNDCDLPIFNPAQFLELVRGKSLAFVGDSVGRNQMQSLICLLLRVTYAVDASVTEDEKFRRYHFPTHNFTVASFWSPFLVRAHEADPNGPTLTGLFNLHLDQVDTNWTTQMTPFDYVIVSAGHWFFRPTMFFEADQLVGCHYCLHPNVTDLTMYYSYRRAFRAALRAFNDLPGFRGTVFLRTFAPSHFENGEWNKGGNCVRQRPFRSNETRMDGYNLEMYMAQLEEYRAAEGEGKEKGVRFRLLDTTEAMLLRPDGHPGRFGHRPDENVTLYNDCVHWCLPGPIDNWNDFLLHMLKNEGGRSAAGRRSRNDRKSTIK